MRMTQIDVATFALGLKSGDEGMVIQAVPRLSREADLFMVAARADGMPPMVLLVDNAAIGNSDTGLSSLTAAHSLVSWGRRHLPSSWIDVDGGPVWVSMNGSDNFHVLLVDGAGLVTFCKVSWPFESEGSFRALARAFPIYCGAFVNVLNGLQRDLVSDRLEKTSDREI